MVNDKMYNAFLNMYKDVKLCVTYNCCKPDYFHCDRSEKTGEFIAFSVCNLQNFAENQTLME